MKALPSKYQEIVSQLKEKIKQARAKAVYTVNAQLLAVYWEIGKTILEQQAEEGWGTKVIDRLADDLRAEFPDMRGLSVRNLKYMRAFAEAYPGFNILPEKGQNLAETISSEFVQIPSAQLTRNDKSQFVQTQLAQLSWSHHTAILDKISDPQIREFYILKTIENGWSRNVMIHQIEAELHKRQGKITSNFKQTIAPPDSELVQQVFKDKYRFEFVYLGEKATERDLENALTEQITKFLIELGKGFSFVGRQYKINAGSKEYFLDLLFYHIKLKCYVVIELKIDEFRPEYKGKMEFYLNLVDDQLKEEDINPSIGLILCKTMDGAIVKYALHESTKPIGVAAYRVSNTLPKEMKKELPSVKELESELNREVNVWQKPIDIKLSKLKELLTNLKSEEVKEKRTPQNTARVFEEFILPLKQKITRSLNREIIPLFESYEWMIWTDSQGHNTNKAATEHLKKDLKYFCHTFKIEIKLKGFKKAGKKAFDVFKDIRIQLSNYNYFCEFGGLAGIVLDKLYHEIPDKNELTTVTEKFTEWVLDEINQRLEQLSKT